MSREHEFGEDALALPRRLYRTRGSGHVTTMRPAESGVFVAGQTRTIAPVRTRDGLLPVVARNTYRAMRSRPTGGRSGAVVASVRSTHLERR